MTDKVDYLDEDPIIPSQKYCVVSVLTPKNFKKSAEVENTATDVFSFTGLIPVADGEVVTLETHNSLIDEHNKLLKEMVALKTELQGIKNKNDDEQKNITMYTFKVRGAYETVDEAQKRIQYLNSIDNNVNIYLAEVGKWCPFDDDPEKAKDSVYKDEELNRLMKGYKENQEKGKQLFEQRKAEMVSKALSDTKEKKEKLKKQDENDRKKLIAGLQEKIDSDSSTPNTKMEDALKEKEKLLQEKEEKVKDGKKEIDQKKSEIHSKEDKVRKLNEEMAAAKKKYEEHLAKLSTSKTV
jgi:chromosome segregation ATPase